MEESSTKLEIAECFLVLTREMMVDKITVQKVVEAAGISRQTFYYHFRDIIDVIEWTLKRNLEETLHKSLQAENSVQALRVFIDNAYENRELMNQLRYSKNRVEVEDILLDAFRAYLFEVVKKYPPKIQLSLADVELALEYHTHGIIGLLLTELNKKDFDAEKLATQMARLAREVHDFE